MLGLLDKPTSGAIAIGGIEATQLSDTEKAQMRKFLIGFIFQSYNLLVDLTVLENVMLPLMMTQNSPSTAIKESATSILEKVGLAKQASKPATKLSGGQMQRVAVARALVNQPALVLADEPTGNLDSKTSQDIISLMKELNRDLRQTFVVVTHAREMFGSVDRIITLKDGRIERIEEQQVRDHGF